MKELKPIKDFEGLYSISKNGDIFSNYKNIYLKQYIDGKGYKFVRLKKNGRYYNKKVHRLIADAFIPNEHNKPQVNHIDGDKTNNNISNLEWCTASENQIHRCRVLKKIWSKKIMCVETGVIYNSIKEAAKSVGVSPSKISCVANNKKYRHTSAGYHWEFVV